jgi:hypothetical protein
MKMKLVAALFASLLVIPFAVSSCGGYDCVQHSCAEYNPSAADINVSICQHPQGDCGEGCKGWRVLDTDGNKISDCADSEPGNCEPFMEDDARNYCTLGHTVGCGQAGTACTVSGDCCAGLFCSLNICG